MAIQEARTPLSTHEERDDTSGRLEGKVDLVITALFGNRLDPEDHGLTGEVRSLSKTIDAKFDRLFKAALTLFGIGATVGATLLVGLIH